ncbi:MAG: RNA 2',3'-cyclic phosphodiesterase [Gemmatimonadetes bacterium]|nr:MAG: RNA 2',3'-cyclic phosphodiesterase [Gemmatimonadota bacterium]PYP25103.1 MAG: RNA 2',3'-cyclic phosphodiesterase [Gemmatimonadota bacterium]
MDSLARRALRRRDPAARRARVRGRGGRPAWLSARQPGAGAAAARLRLFVALNLPSPVRQALWQTVAPLRERGLPVKWVRPDGIHLTLKFLGDVAEERAADVRAALGRAAAGARPLPLALGEFGVFPDFQRPRVVWAGITADSRLEILQHRVEQEFAPLGFPTEARPFRPHVTLGRAAREARPRDFAGLEAALGALQFEATVVVESVDLMQSTLESAGAVYHVRHSERLS